MTPAAGLPILSAAAIDTNKKKYSSGRIQKYIKSGTGTGTGTVYETFCSRSFISREFKIYDIISKRFFKIRLSILVGTYPPGLGSK